MEIIINESFSDEDEFLFDKIKEKKFESEEILKLKVQAEEIAKETEITELISYELVKPNLTHNLPHQPDGALRILRDFNGSALLADEVGLGKTITTGITLKECITRGFVNKALILTPPSLVNQWVEELREKFNLDFKIIEDESDWEKGNFLIASIDRVKSFDKSQGRFRHWKAHEIPWDFLVVDEAHKLKERNTVRWRFVDKIQKKRFLILTATPFQNDLLELYNLLHLLKKGHLGTIKEFRKKFLNRGNRRHPLNPKELRMKLEEVMIRRKRAQTEVEYKRRIPEIIPVVLTPEEKEIYDSLCELLKTQYFLANGDEINGKLVVYSILPKITSSSRSAIESLEKIVNSDRYHEKTKEIATKILEGYKSLKKDSKMDKLVEIINNIMEEEENPRILIYTKHPSTLKYIVEKLAKYNLKIVEFTGGLTREERTEKINEFKNGANILISTETGAEGLNFQFCHNLINYDLPWNPMSVEQRIGRLDRIGQKHDIRIYSLATKDTMEEYIVDLIINKMCCVGLVIGELPIILFNLGLDNYDDNGVGRIEEMLMNSFISSKNNLQLFSTEIKKIAEMIEKGIEDYKENNNVNTKLLDD